MRKGTRKRKELGFVSQGKKGVDAEYRREGEGDGVDLVLR